MPTGYTSKLMNEGESFNAFVLRCARAMGACITLRDEPNSVPTPEVFEPSSHYGERLKEKEAELAELRSVKRPDKQIFAEKRLDAEIQSMEKYKAEHSKEDQRLGNMIKLVKAWTVPTSQHEGLKDFMLQQLQISRNDSEGYVDKRIARLQELKENPLNYFEQLLIEAQSDVRREQKAVDDEKSRCEDRTEWIQSLRKSLL